ncbi:hypothetical protein AVEN_253166-1 [Araneus ventricosus]|uniref:Uncharacterized protein n=1 Tax=Araneus ventricosus TaxID=182803 RepID=A0A4Y2HQQ8_ARAVE|nr:hypothetical protein AVEN_253166-1 [Araneus ventricosus]
MKRKKKPHVKKIHTRQKKSLAVDFIAADQTRYERKISKISPRNKAERKEGVRRPRNCANPQSKLKLKKEVGSVAKRPFGVATIGRRSLIFTVSRLRTRMRVDGGASLVACATRNEGSTTN